MHYGFSRLLYRILLVLRQLHRMQIQKLLQCIQTATLHVPAGSIEAYETTSPWSIFTNIVGINEPGDVNGDGGINISDVTSLIDLLLSGGEISAGADVNGDGQVNISDVTALIDYLLSGSW